MQTKHKNLTRILIKTLKIDIKYLKNNEIRYGMIKLVNKYKPSQTCYDLKANY